MADPRRCAWWRYHTGSRVLATEPEDADLPDATLWLVVIAWAQRNGIPLSSGYVEIGRTDE